MTRWSATAMVLLASCSSNGLEVVRQTHDGITAFQQANVEPDKLVVINAVEYRGQFTRNGECLELISDGVRYTPVFNNAEHLRTAVRDSSMPRTPALWSLAGGPMDQSLSVPASVLGRCQRPLFKIVSITGPRVTSAS